MAIRVAWIAALLVLIIFGIGGKVEHDEWIDKMIADLAAARKSVPDDFKSEERQKKSKKLIPEQFRNTFRSAWVQKKPSSYYAI